MIIIMYPRLGIYYKCYTVRDKIREICLIQVIRSGVTKTHP